MTEHTCLSPDHAIAIAESVFASRYGDASFAYVAGSIIRGEGTKLSDIDLVVIYNDLIAARRESFYVESTPVEVFVHDRQTLAWFVDDDVARGTPSILQMIAEGTLIGDLQSEGEALRHEICVRLAAGPAALSSEVLNALRYQITDALDDLCGKRTAEEMTAIGTSLYPQLMTLALRGRGRWNGTGKWAPRLLRSFNPDLADRFSDAFMSLFYQNNPLPVIQLAEAELESHGGKLFDGDCRVAPQSWRVTK